LDVHFTSHFYLAKGVKKDPYGFGVEVFRPSLTTDEEIFPRKLGETVAVCRSACAPGGTTKDFSCTSELCSWSAWLMEIVRCERLCQFQIAVVSGFVLHGSRL